MFPKQGKHYGCARFPYRTRREASISSLDVFFDRQYCNSKKKDDSDKKNDTCLSLVSDSDD